MCKLPPPAPPEAPVAGLGGAPTPAANLGADATVEGGGIADEGWVTVGLTSRSRSLTTKM